MTDNRMQPIANIRRGMDVNDRSRGANPEQINECGEPSWGRTGRARHDELLVKIFRQ